MRLLDLLFPPRRGELLTRDLTDDDFLALLAPRFVGATTPETVALLPFADPRVRGAIHEAKYAESERAFTLLAKALCEYLREADTDLRGAVLVPVPLGKARRKRRGYNQAEEVVRRVAEMLELPCAPETLIRTRETLSQVALPRLARKRNLRGAFAAKAPLSPVLLYIVVDDVLTTGATLQAAADALLASGAERVLPIALAH